MKKSALLLAIIILITMPLSVQAASTWAITIRPGLSFSGSEVTCTATIVANTTSEHIDATIKLWENGKCIKTWTSSGDGYIFFSERASAVKGNTYKVTVDASVAGVSRPTVSFSKEYT